MSAKEVDHFKEEVVISVKCNFHLHFMVLLCLLFIAFVNDGNKYVKTGTKEKVCPLLRVNYGKNIFMLIQ